MQMYDLDIKDSRLYDYLAEKNEQESTEDTYSDFYDEAMDFAMEMERDLYDRD
jgi:hypothetical protein